jgi:flavin reductase
MTMPAFSDESDVQTIEDAFRAGMRQLASGVAIVTSVLDGERFGLVATAVCSVSVAPPTLLASVNHHASAYNAIERSGIMGVSIIGSAQHDLVDVFTDPGRRAERFRDGQWTHLVTGAPILKGALAIFDCRIVARMSYATHTLFLGTPEEVRIADTPQLPLIHFNRRISALT